MVVKGSQNFNCYLKVILTIPRITKTRQKYTSGSNKTYPKLIVNFFTFKIRKKGAKEQSPTSKRSRRKLKKWGSMIVFEENVFHLRFTNEDVKLEETAAGHLVVSLVKIIIDNKEEIVEELEQNKRQSGNHLKELRKHTENMGILQR